MYSSTLSLTLALGGVGVQRHVPVALPPGKPRYPLWTPGPVWTSAENRAPHWNLIPGTPCPWRVAIPTELFRPNLHVLVYYVHMPVYIDTVYIYIHKYTVQAGFQGDSLFPIEIYIKKLKNYKM